MCFFPVIVFNILKTLLVLLHDGLFGGFHDPRKFDADYRRFNVRLWSLCSRIAAHPGRIRQPLGLYLTRSRSFGQKASQLKRLSTVSSQTPVSVSPVQPLTPSVCSTKHRQLFDQTVNSSVQPTSVHFLFALCVSFLLPQAVCNSFKSVPVE